VAGAARFTAILMPLVLYPQLISPATRCCFRLRACTHAQDPPIHDEHFNLLHAELASKPSGGRAG
jgi:hypothetical protein